LRSIVPSSFISKASISAAGYPLAIPGIEFVGEIVDVGMLLMYEQQLRRIIPFQSEP
jgi:hypothetical protein